MCLDVQSVYIFSGWLIKGIWKYNSPVKARNQAAAQMQREEPWEELSREHSNTPVKVDEVEAGAGMSCRLQQHKVQ